MLIKYHMTCNSNASTAFPWEVAGNDSHCASISSRLALNASFQYKVGPVPTTMYIQAILIYYTCYILTSSAMSYMKKLHDNLIYGDRQYSSNIFLRIWRRLSTGRADYWWVFRYFKRQLFDTVLYVRSIWCLWPLTEKTYLFVFFFVNLNVGWQEDFSRLQN